MKNITTSKYDGCMADGLFKALTKEEQMDFRKWARENHAPGGEVNSLWHPIVRDECRKIDGEVQS